MRHAAIEAKLASMEALDEGETRFYENVDADALKEKQEALSAVLEQIVDSGKLNAAELKMVRRQASRIHTQGLRHTRPCTHVCTQVLAHTRPQTHTSSHAHTGSRASSHTCPKFSHTHKFSRAHKFSRKSHTCRFEPVCLEHENSILALSYRSLRSYSPPQMSSTRRSFCFLFVK